MVCFELRNTKFMNHRRQRFIMGTLIAHQPTRKARCGIARKAEVVPLSPIAGVDKRMRPLPARPFSIVMTTVQAVGGTIIPSRTPPLAAERALQLRYHYVEFLTEHLSDCCRVFEGDLQEMLVFAVLGQVHVRALLDAQPDGPSSRRSVPAGRDQRLAHRRRHGHPAADRAPQARQAQSRGWVVPKASGLWMLATRDGAAAGARGQADIDALDARSMERVLRLARADEPRS